MTYKKISHFLFSFALYNSLKIYIWNTSNNIQYCMNILIGLVRSELSGENDYKC